MGNRIFVFVGILALLSVGAQAGVIRMDSHWPSAGPLLLDNSGTAWNDNAGEVTIWEHYQAPSPEQCAVGFTGETDEDPMIHIVKSVTNDSDFAWTAYEIIVTGANASYVAGSATCDLFATWIEQGNTLMFQAPQPVQIGDTVTFEFDVNLGKGTFSFDIHQQPIPEPATLATLVAGAMALIRRRAS